MITELELEDKLKILQSKKAFGPDGILNEMLKYTTRKYKSPSLRMESNSIPTTTVAFV